MSTTRHGRPMEPGRGGSTEGGLPPLRHGGRPPGPARRRRWPMLAALAAGALAFGGLCGYAVRDAGVQLSTTGPAQDAHLGPKATEDLMFRVVSDLPSLMETATLEYDGSDVLDDAYVGDGELTYRPTALEEGTHTLRFSIDQPLVPWPARRSWTFTVDHSRPNIDITAPTRPAVRGAPVTLEGRVDEPSTVTVDDAPVDVA
ncbi:MAG TPA: hypothetical protein VK904_05105, partial [Miltoncostaeaceae bacterium]|nr:hypothetical protein [Miltoncostaeaceae bacterium]